MSNTYQFSTKEKKYEVFFGQEDHVEVYEIENPKEGLIFEDSKNFNVFVNSITDALEKRQAEKENG